MLLTPRTFFDRFGQKPNKARGQHFLVQPKTAARVVTALGIEPGDHVVEIGPGLGALTAFLITYPCTLHLVEIDEMVAKALSEVIPKGAAASVRWHVQDVLSLDWEGITPPSGSPRPLKVIGNIPYHISSPLLFQLIEAHRLIARAVLMVQREVGYRWTASPGVKDYGVPTVILHSCAKAERLFPVGAKQFLPPPKVESLVVRLDFSPHPLWEPISYSLFHEVVASVFQHRRKTIANSLKAFALRRGTVGQSADVITSCLERCRIEPTRRPETISPEEYRALAGCLSSYRKGATSPTTHTLTP